MAANLLIVLTAQKTGHIATWPIGIRKNTANSAKANPPVK
jgi:hypothetical protein